MNTLRREFQESFVKYCFDMGLSEEAAAEAFHVVHLCEAFDKNAHFREGWLAAMNKEAGQGAGSTMEQMKSFIPQTTQHAGMGAAIGAGLGALAHVGPLKPLGVVGRAALGGAGGAGVGAAWSTHPTATGGVGGGLAGAAAGLRLPGPWWLKGLGAIGGAATGALAGGGAGRLFGPTQPSSTDGPGIASPYLPDMLYGSSEASGDKGSIFDIPGSGVVTGGAGHAAHMPGGPPAPLQGAFDDMKHIDEQLKATQEQAQTALQTPGLAGSSQSAMFQQRIADLQKQKQQLLSGSNSFLGMMRSQQGKSLNSLDNYISEATKARAATEPQATAMDAWFRNHQTGFWPQLFNRVTGAGNRASEMANRQRLLTQGINQGQEQRRNVGQMMQPLYE